MTPTEIQDQLDKHWPDLNRSGQVEAAARRLGVTQTAVWRWLRGDRKIPMLPLKPKHFRP